MPITQNFVDLRAVDVENFKAGKEKLQEDYSFDQETFSLGEVKVGGGYQVKWDGDWHKTTMWGFRNLLKLHCIPPENFGLRIPPHLLRHNCEELKARVDKEVIAFMRDDGAVVNFVENPYHTAKHLDLIGMVESLSHLTLERFSISDRGMELTVTNERLKELRPKVNDIIKVGYKISSSETGGGRPKAAFLLYRLVCKNGMVLADQWGTARWPYDKRMKYRSCLRKFREDFSGLNLEQDLLAQGYKAMVNKRVTDRDFVKIWRTAKRIVDSREGADQLLGVEKDRRLDLFRQVRNRRLENKKRLGREPKSPELTQWSGYHLLNRVTERAQNYDFLAQKNLEQLGGRIITMISQAEEDKR